MEKMQQKCIFRKKRKAPEKPPCTGICPSISVMFWRQPRRRMRARGRKRRKRVVRQIIMYTATEMWVHILWEKLLPKCFHSRFPRPTVIETGPRIFLAAKYCPSGRAPRLCWCRRTAERVDHRLDLLAALSTYELCRRAASSAAAASAAVRTPAPAHTVPPSVRPRSFFRGGRKVERRGERGGLLVIAQLKRFLSVLIWLKCVNYKQTNN